MPAVTDEYILPRNDSEIERLERQHKCVLSCQGYYLHPDIHIPSVGGRIAELCTGSTIWLREFAPTHPNVEFHGFDISDLMFPEPDQVPPNVELHVTDVKQQFDGHWQGYFDVVHIRWIQVALAKDEWAPLVRNITSLLKPGGWLQWVEDDRVNVIRHACRQPAPLGTVKRALTASTNHTGWRPEAFHHLAFMNRALWPDDKAQAMANGSMNLDAFMRDPKYGNMDRVSCDSFIIDREDDGGEVRRNWAELSIEIMWAMKLRQKKENIIDMTFEEWEEKSMDEINRGAQWVSRATVFTGQKKLAL